MSEIERLQDAFLKADALAQKGDAQAAADAKAFAQEIRRLQSSPQSAPKRDGFLAQVNAGIAQGVGGLVDFINPFDKPMGPIPGTGSAQTGLANLMERGGINVAQGQPKGLVENFARGTGEAASYLIPFGAGAKALSRAPGLTGQVSGELSKGISTKTAALSEPVLGGVAQMAGQATEDAGYPQYRQIAEMAAPLGVAGATMAAVPAARATVNAAERVPGVGVPVRVGKAAYSAVAPMTTSGARIQAREQLERQLGGRERMLEVGETIDPRSGLTAAQQTQDPNLLALEAAAKEENPLIREALNAKDKAARFRAAEDIEGMGGDVKAARQFFGTRLADYRKSMAQRAERSLLMAKESAEGVGPRAAETTTSSRAVDRLKGALEDMKSENRAKWLAVPDEATVATDTTRSAISEIIRGQAWAQRRNIPEDLKTILDGETPIKPETTVHELYALYKQMGFIGREAMAGTTPNEDVNRITVAVRQAILDDIEGFSGDSAVAATIADARAHTAAMKETFTQGVVGKILKRTRNTDETIAPELALSKTIGVGGAEAKVASDQIRRAAPEAAEEIAEYTRGQFIDKLFKPNGEFSRDMAAGWLRQNREFLNEYPGLRAEFSRAAQNAAEAERFAAKASIKSDLADKSAIKRFNSGQEAQAVKAILGADSPVEAARSIVATARKDQSGAALGGVKAAISRYLIDSATSGEVLTGKALKGLLAKGETADAIREVMGPQEMGRLRVMADTLEKLDAAQKASPKGPVMDSAPMRIIETVAAVAGAKAGAAMSRAAGGISNAGTQLQAASRGSSYATNLLDRLTNDKARQILYDAIQDPELMRVLMLNTSKKDVPEWAQRKIAPYLAASISQTTSE